MVKREGGEEKEKQENDVNKLYKENEIKISSKYVKICLTTQFKKYIYKLNISHLPVW